MDNASKPDVSGVADPSKLLFDDLRHFGDSLARNEEVGEKRFNFFVTLITAVAAGLATLHAGKELKVDLDKLPSITGWAIAGLLLFGLMTYLRMLQRIKVKIEYQETLRFIRDELVALEQGPKNYSVPRKPDTKEKTASERQSGTKKKIDWNKARRAAVSGGLAVLVGFIDAVLAGVLVVVVRHGVYEAMIVGVALFILLGGLAVLEEIGGLAVLKKAIPRDAS